MLKRWVEVSTESGSDRVLALSLWERVGRGLSGENVAYQYFFKRQIWAFQDRKLFGAGSGRPSPQPSPTGRGRNKTIVLRGISIPPFQ